jgi:mRNA interferase HigB
MKYPDAESPLKAWFRDRIARGMEQCAGCASGFS